MNLLRRSRCARRGGWLVSAAVAVSVAAAACGSGGGATHAGGGTPAAGVLGAKNVAAGTPVTVGLISASASDNPLSAQFQRVEQGMQMSLRYANDYLGGIAGHRIALFICQGGETPAGAQDCANQMVNRNVVAVISPFTATGASSVPILVAAKIPVVALSGTSTEELTSPGAFSLTGGFAVTLAAFADYARNNGVKKVAMLAIDGPAVLQAVNGLGGVVFRKAGVAFQSIPVPVGTADMTPQLQAAVSGGADAVSMVGDLTFCTSWLQAYQTLGLSQPRYIINTCIDPSSLKSFGSVIRGSVMTGSASTDVATRDAKVYGAIGATYDKKVDPDPNKSAGQSLGAVTLLSFVNFFKGYTGDVTAATVLNQVRTAKDVPMFLGNGATFTCDGKAIPILPNVCSPDISIGKVGDDGRLEDPKLVNTAPLFKL